MRNRQALLALALLAGLLAPAAAAQPLKTLKAGVVKIKVVRADGEEDTGAGNVIGVKGKAIFILTAHHVVDGAESVKVSFDSARWEKYDATIYRFDEALDIATIWVTHPEPPTELPKYQARIARPTNGEAVTAVGHPPGLEWEEARETVVRTSDPDDTRMFRISNNRIDRGNSGGPLFDKEGALIGTVIRVGAKHATVVQIEDTLVKLEEWRTPISNLTQGAVAAVGAGEEETPGESRRKLRAPSFVGLTLADVLSRHYDAAGGLEAWRAVGSLSASGTVSDGTSFVYTAKRPLKLRYEQFDAAGHLALVHILNGTNGWLWTPAAFEPMPSPFATAWVSMGLEGPLMDWQAKGNRLELVGREEWRGRRAHKIKTTLASGHVVYYFVDTSTFELIGSFFPQHPLGLTDYWTSSSDFRQIARGLVVSFVTESGCPACGDPLRETISTIEVDPIVSDGLFLRP